MRKIKFRGKGIADDEWYFGDLIQSRSGDAWIITEHYVATTEAITLNTCASPQVNPDTIGQYTGLKDKNGKEIYDGDIVKITDKKIKNNKVIRIQALTAEISWSEEYLAYILITTSIKDAFENLGDYLDFDIEVIGNIYDNPELLEKD